MVSGIHDKESSENLSFEDAYAQLEKIVNALETGGLTLDEATDLY